MQDHYLKYKLSAGSARVLNCLRIYQETAQDQDASPEYLFRHPRLNRVIFLKDAAPGARIGKLVGTKLYFPYDEDMPHEGGESMFIGDRHFHGMLAGKLGDPAAVDPAIIAHDQKILATLDAIPAFDPFLLKDRFETEELPLPPAYCAITPEEWQAVRLFLRARIAPMVTLALGDGGNRSAQRVDLFVDKIWAARDIAALAPLIEAFRLPPERTPDILYGWKGIAYFEKQSAAHATGIRRLALWLRDGSAPLDYLAPPARRELDGSRRLVSGKLRDNWGRAQAIFQDYNQSYDDLFGDRRDPAAFVRFINSAAENFWVLGNSITRIYHAVDIWDAMTRRFPERRLKAAPLVEVFHVLGDVL